MCMCDYIYGTQHLKDKSNIYELSFYVKSKSKKEIKEMSSDDKQIKSKNVISLHLSFNP